MQGGRSSLVKMSNNRLKDAPKNAADASVARIFIMATEAEREEARLARAFGGAKKAAVVIKPTEQSGPVFL